MTDLNEPANGGYVAVANTRNDVWVFRRDDAAADGERWWFFLSQFAGNNDHRTWAEVCELGPVAYVGEFVNRQEA